MPKGIVIHEGVAVKQQRYDGSGHGLLSNPPRLMRKYRRHPLLEAPRFQSFLFNHRNFVSAFVSLH